MGKLWRAATRKILSLEFSVFFKDTCGSEEWRWGGGGGGVCVCVGGVEPLTLQFMDNCFTSSTIASHL